jgi:hypothetical protein
MPDLRSVVHAHEDDLELYSRGRLEPGHTLTVEAHLRDCPSCRGRLSQCIGLRRDFHPTGTTKAEETSERSELGLTAGDDAVLQELNPLSLDRQKVTIADISIDALSIHASESVFPGTMVQLRIRNTVLLGEVRECSVVENGYRIALRLQSEF